VSPQLLLLWAGVDFVFFYIGDKGKRWDRCRECKEKLMLRVAKEQRLLEEGIPQIRPDEGNTDDIDWERGGPGGFSYMDLPPAIQRAFKRSQEFEDAAVLVCSSHLWMCMNIRMLTDKPMLLVDLANPNRGLPPRAMERWYAATARDVLQWSPVHLQTVIVRDDLFRSVLPTKGCTTSMDAESINGEMECYNGSWDFADFLPFVGQPSLYVQARWAGPSGRAKGASGSILVMREGSAGKFSKTLRGSFFFAVFRQLAKAMALSVRYLIDDTDRPSFEEIALHRAAIVFLGITTAKRTPRDIYMMELPLFFPSKALKAVAIAGTGYYSSTICDDGPWRRRLSREPVPPLCSWLRTAFQLELVSFYRVPHLFLFESAADLASRLATTSDEELRRASEAMGRFSAWQVEDDLAFWRNAVLALACAARAGRPAKAAGAALPAPPHADHADPRCLFGFASANGEACCPIDCGTCEEEECEELPPGPEFCCPSRVAAAQPCSAAVAPCGLEATAGTRGSSCLEDPALCTPASMRFATHLDQGPVLE